jgi:hypothetical protein
VQREIAHATADRRHRFEQTVAVVEPAVVGRDATAVDAVDQADGPSAGCSKRAQQTARLGARLGELGLRLGVRHDPGTRAELELRHRRR